MVEVKDIEGIDLQGEPAVSSQNEILGQAEVHVVKIRETGLPFLFNI
jgi:hypothetical protein